MKQHKVESKFQKMCIKYLKQDRIHQQRCQNQIKAFIRQNRYNEAIDMFIEAAKSINISKEEASYLELRQLFKEQIKPNLRPTYRTCQLLWSLSELMENYSSGVRYLHYYIKGLKLYQKYMATCTNPNGVMSLAQVHVWQTRGYHRLKDNKALDVIMPCVNGIFDTISSRVPFSQEAIEAQMLKSQCLYDMKEYKNAVKESIILLRLIKESGDRYWKQYYSRILSNMGYCYMELKKDQRAQDVFEKAITFSTVHGVFDLAKYHFLRQNFEKTLHYLFKLIEEVVSSYKSQKARHYMHFDSQEVLRMIDASHEALGLKMLDDGSWMAPSKMADLKDIQVLIKGARSEDLCRFPDEDLDFAELWIMLLKRQYFSFNSYHIYDEKANVLLRYDRNNERWYKAIDEFEKAVNSKDAKWNRYRLIKLHDLYFRVGFIEEALFSLERIEDVSSWILCSKADRLIDLGYFYQAYQALDMVDTTVKCKATWVTEKYTENILLPKAWCHFQIGDNVKALEVLELAEKGNISEEHAKYATFFQLMMKGHINYRLQQHEECDRYLKKAHKVHKSYKLTGNSDDILYTLILQTLNAFVSKSKHLVALLEKIFIKSYKELLILTNKLYSRFNSEEMALFYQVYFPHLRKKYKRRFGVYRNSQMISNLFHGIKRQDIITAD